VKILLLHQYFLGDNDPGGSRFNQFVKYWTAKGHEITVVAGTVHYATGKKEDKYKGKWVTKEAYNDKVTIYRCFVSEGYNKSFLGRLFAYFSFTLSSLWACLFLIRRHDVVLVTSPPLFVGITGIITKWIKRTPMVFEIRDLWPESAIDTGVLKSSFLIKMAYWIERLSYKNATKINVLTPAFKEALIRKKNVPEEKIIFIPNGADLDIFQPGNRNNWVRDEYKLGNKFLVTYMGAHGVANNLLSLLRVAEACKDNEDIVFMLIGDGMEKPMLEAYAEKSQLTNVRFVPSQPKSIIPDFCNASDVCTAVLKKVDTFKTVYPNKVFDYMSCSKPILIGIDGVARQLVEESGSGYYVDPEDVVQFKSQILKLYLNEDLRYKLGESGYSFVKEHYSRESLADRYQSELYKIYNGGVSL
jgi:glycosyltransferase involved in cell wall biosynthesis